MRGDARSAGLVLLSLGKRASVLLLGALSPDGSSGQAVSLLRSCCSPYFPGEPTGAPPQCPGASGNRGASSLHFR
ncbi:hypothetical protein NDU88_011354 [Pleurodeles waltl]|uniref:Secreted protein n=1 Tax=Pleurodeles waltl TaxID=8319 RepID=A0AAV7QWZ6_PLEWA|nr:hypothetical protein NDU88_011354 [Pleurodeles waltl]